jgi:predicted small secreted protein
LEKLCKFLVLIAVLAASSTYQAGINPPGVYGADRKFLVLIAVLAASSTYQAGINPPGVSGADRKFLD